jgi:periplasmic divalent cation tolerance protein
MTEISAAGAAASVEALRLVYTTFPDLDAACAFARHMVGQRFAACVNLYPGMTAIYEWKGAIESASEVGVLIKTVESRLAATLAEARARHPYETPALLVLGRADANADYLAWALAQTRPGQESHG